MDSRRVHLETLDVGVNKPFKDHMRQEYDDFMWDQYDTPDAERKKVERINVGFWVNKVWYDDEKSRKKPFRSLSSVVASKLQHCVRR